MLKYLLRGNILPVCMGMSLLMLLGSCTSPKKFEYFNDLPKNSTRTQLPDLSFPQTPIQNDDILEIKISGRNEATASDFNKKSAGYGAGPEGAIPQYLVDKDGQIDLYLVGKIKVEGLGIEETKQKITAAIKPYLLDAIVNVRLLNFRFSVLGEVKNPGSYSIPHEKISILEALGYAGDMTFYGKRKNVKVYRDSAGAREIGIVNFNSKAVLTSPYFYLKRNDVLYVETNSRLRQTENFYSRASLLVGMLSSIVAILVLTKN